MVAPHHCLYAKRCTLSHFSRSLRLASYDLHVLELRVHARRSSIDREIKNRENLVLTRFGTIREILYPRKFPAIRYA